MKLDYTELMHTALTLEGTMGDTYNRFYDYSFRNCVLLSMQGVKSPVAAYRKWAELGRQVQKGSKAKEILRPIMFNKKDENGKPELDKDGNQEQGQFFKLTKCLFAYDDTDGEALEIPEPKDWKLEEALKNLEITRVDFAMNRGNVQGYSFKQSIAINPMAGEPLPTLFHELGHIVLGHTDASDTTHKGVKEFQAEAVSYLSMHELKQEFNQSESRAYIQNWLKGKGEKPTDKDISQVFTAVEKIIKAGRIQ